MVEKRLDPDDPMELVGVTFADGNLEEMAECLIEEYIRDGWDDERLLHLFRDPFYRLTHQIYREKGEAYVLALISGLREQWGYWKGDDISLRLRKDEVKKKILDTHQEDSIQIEGTHHAVE
jgi:hypothetical protein